VSGASGGVACLSEERADLPRSVAVGSLVGDRMNPLERKLDAGKPHVQFDERGVETECMAGYSDTSNRKGWSRLRPVLTTTAPLLDSTRPRGGLSSAGAEKQCLRSDRSGTAVQAAGASTQASWTSG